MPMGNLLEDVHAQPFPEFHHALLMAGGAEVTALAGEGEQVFMAAVFAFDTGKAVVQIAAIEIAVNHLLDVRPPEAVMLGKMIIINLNERFKTVLDATIIIGCLGVSWTIDSRGRGHDFSPLRTSCPHFFVFLVGTAFHGSSGQGCFG
jgi:hypothetical protein